MSVPALELRAIADATGGELLRGDPSTVLHTFEIDTRRLEPGGCFFALQGERSDGHAFLGQARAAGAAAAIVARTPEDEAPDAVLRVDDPRRALWRCGELVRERCAGMKVVAITGSTGKTTTKELLAAGLAATARVHRTPGNYNNELGVPLTLLACPDDAEIVVAELGMSAPGEIAALTRLVDPDVGLVTNVRPAHLEFFDSIDEIAAAKGELFAMLREDAVSVVNLDDEQLRVQAMRHAGPRLTFGRNGGADLRWTGIVDRFLPGATLRFRHDGRDHELPLEIGGAHAAFDALAALAVVVALGHELEPAMRAMARVEAGEGRGKVHRLGDGVTLVDDSYNSSPAALGSVLRTLKNTATGGRKVLVMGDMLELGAEGPALHTEAGRQIAAAGVEVLFCVGKLARDTAEAARRGGVAETHMLRDAQRAAREVVEGLRPGDFVVVKGSRGIRLERVVDALVRRGGRDG